MQRRPWLPPHHCRRHLAWCQWGHPCPPSSQRLHCGAHAFAMRGAQAASSAQPSPAQHSTAQHSTVQHSTAAWHHPRLRVRRMTRTRVRLVPQSSVNQFCKPVPRSTAVQFLRAPPQWHAAPRCMYPYVAAVQRCMQVCMYIDETPRLSSVIPLCFLVLVVVSVNVTPCATVACFAAKPAVYNEGLGGPRNNRGLGFSPRQNPAGKCYAKPR